MTDLKHGPSVSAAEAEFCRGLEELVRDHIHECLAVASCSSSAASARDSGGANVAADEDDGDDGGGDQLARRRRRSDLEAGGGEDDDDDDEPSSSAARRMRHSRILSRWAARRAEEMMIDTIERRNRESELLALAGLHTVSMLDSSFLRRDDDPPSHGRSQPSDRPPIASRASSILRQWREIEDEAAALDRARARISRQQRRRQGHDVSERSESEWSDGVSLHPRTEEESRDSSREQSPDVGDGERERVRQIVRGWMNEEETSPRDPPPQGESSPRRAAAAASSVVLGETERERVRNVREWVQMASQQSGSGGGRDGSVVDHEEGQPEHVRRDLLRVRGRQARLDLIVRIVRERERELQGISEHRAVSDFAHRNRIQSLLRGRFLRNGSSVEEERPPSVAARELGQLRQRHPVSGIREGFRFRLENIVRGQAASTHSVSSAGNNIDEVRNDQSQLDIALDPPTENQDQAPSNSESGDTLPMQEADREEFESTNVHNLDWQESAIQGSDWQDRLTENGTTDWQPPTEARYDDWRDGSNEVSDSNWQENIDQDWTQGAPENEDGGDSQLPEAHGEWHEDSSREAAREWQDGPSDPPRTQRAIPIRRVSRFHPPDDESVYSMELRELLSRRSVSNLLRSGFRESLDQLIQSYVQRQSRSPIDWDLQETLPTPVSPEQDRNQQRDVVEDPEDTIARLPRVLPSPPIPPPQPLWHQDLHHNHWPRHSMHRSEMELDFINDLRADMTRLQQGMSHMQRMLEACMDMQLELQRSVRQEVSAALNRSSGGQGVDEGSSVDGSKWGHVKKGTCCVCCDGHIDSLLYRCGHMCTCSKCANELVRGGGKCPLCRAPIVEVIRAYSIL
ncbi:hypothetical protein QJS10_CPA09g01839 [Acorus calamus]|uniref:RING-type domain-containing protein n=1 Tax=Acorus calamus TaxID=4465 RepID=A0AAV9E5T3_ACOCL|nr:hypothetical protein QJS10_CPA09g01839 [Acorus calamus]